MRIIKDKKYRRIAIIISIPILLIAQYYFFKFGILRPMVKGIEVQIVNGDYISDIDKYVVKLGEGVKLSMGDYIRVPEYSKEPNLTFKVLDNSEVLSIEGDNMTGLKEGYASIGIMNGNSLLKKASIKVVDPKVENLQLTVDEDLYYVGDTSKISSIVEVDYEGFKETSKVEYESSNDKIIEVDGNEVKAVGVGTATVYAKSGNKIDKKTYNIRAKVASIKIQNEIEIEVNQTMKLQPNIITSPKNLKHPKVQYTLLGSKIPISRAIRLDDDGTIVGLRVGEEQVKITCGNKSKIVTIKVVKESIANEKVENLEVSKEIVDNKLILTVTWDYIKGVNDYEIFLRNNSLNETEFTLVKSVPIEEVDSGVATRIQTTIEVDISNLEEIDLDIYVVGKVGDVTTKPSNTVNITHKKEQESIKNLLGNFDRENKVVTLTWDPIDKENVVYSVYVKDKLSEENEFKLYQGDINDNKFDINITAEEIDLEIYVVANYGDKTTTSDVIYVK